MSDDFGEKCHKFYEELRIIICEKIEKEPIEEGMIIVLSALSKLVGFLTLIQDKSTGNTGEKSILHFAKFKIDEAYKLASEDYERIKQETSADS